MTDGLRAALAAAVATVVLGACSGNEESAEHDATTSTRATPAEGVPAPVQRLEITGTEYSFAITPDPAKGVRAGWTELTFRNAGGEAHQVMFARLKDGVDLAELAEAGAGDSSGAAAIEFVDMIGGVSYIGAGQQTTAMVKLPAGTVLAMCYVPDANGKAHALSGMTTMLEVTAGSGEERSTRGADHVVGTITLGPDGYDLPSDVAAGWYHVRNTDVGAPGTGLHELSLMKVDRELTDAETDELVDDIAKNAEPDVALEALGGFGAISPGFDGYLYLDLPRGHYLAVDFMPDARNPRPHLLDGYFARFVH